MLYARFPDGSGTRFYHHADSTVEQVPTPFPARQGFPADADAERALPRRHSDNRYITVPPHYFHLRMPPPTNTRSECFSTPCRTASNPWAYHPIPIRKAHELR